MSVQIHFYIFRKITKKQAIKRQQSKNGVEKIKHIAEKYFPQILKITNIWTHTAVVQFRTEQLV